MVKTSWRDSLTQSGMRTGYTLKTRTRSRSRIWRSLFFPYQYVWYQILAAFLDGQLTVSNQLSFLDLNVPFIVLVLLSTDAPNVFVVFTFRTASVGPR